MSEPITELRKLIIAPERIEKSAEVDFLVGFHGLSFREACQWAIIDAADYVASQSETV